MIWDTFLFAAELDVLDLRLATLESVVDRFVLVESATSHAGKPKPLYFEQNKDRFWPWQDKIIHVIADRLPGGTLDQEDGQREYCAYGIEAAGPDDLILHGDVDEIPDPAMFEYLPFKTYSGPVVFEQALYMFAVDWRHRDRWPGTVAFRRGTGPVSFGAARGLRHTAPRVAGGWHFSWLGGHDAINLKAALSGHPDLAGIPAANQARLLYERGRSPWGDLEPADVDESYPAWIRERRCPPSWFRPR